MQAIVDPLTLAPADHHPGFPQLGQMPGDLRLHQTQGMGEFADAQLTLLFEQHQAT